MDADAYFVNFNVNKELIGPSVSNVFQMLNLCLYLLEAMSKIPIPQNSNTSHLHIKTHYLTNQPKNEETVVDDDYFFWVKMCVLEDFFSTTTLHRSFISKIRISKI